MTGFVKLDRRRKPKMRGRQVVERDGYGDNWPEQRRKALARDNYTCQQCGREGKLKRGRWTVHVHHRRKIALFYDYQTDSIDYSAANDLDNLITLCPRCHKKADAPPKGFRMMA
jgi:5-methylcytosine-specific restriction endonuclease McrA